MLRERKIYEEIQLRAAKRAEGHRYRQYNKILDNMLTVLKRDYYPVAIRKEPSFDDHGEAHAELILGLCDEILKNNYLQDGGKTQEDVQLREDKISTDELFALAAAALWHDAAMIEGRKNHAVNLRKLKYTQAIMSTLDNLDSRLADFYCTVIQNIACAHSDDSSLQHCKTVEMASGRYDGADTVSIRTKALAGLIRLCDELSDDPSRTNDTAMEQVPPEAIVYWLHSRYIDLSQIQVSKDRNRPNEVYIVYKIPYEHLFTAYTLVNGNDVCLYQFVLNRIEKVHAEMTMCCPLFAELTFLENLKVEIFILGDRSKGEELRLDTIELTNAISPVPRPECWQDLSQSKLVSNNENLDKKSVEKLVKKKFQTKKKPK